MTKKLFLILFVACAYGVSGQNWTPPTNGVTSTTLQVGIGTAAPDAQTEILTSSDANLLLTRLYTNVAWPCNAGPTLNPYIWVRSKTTFQGSTTYADLFSVNDNGWAGVGLKNARYPLHVQIGHDYDIISSYWGTKPPGNTATGSRNIFLVNRLSSNTTYNPIQKANDQGIFWNDGQTLKQNTGQDCAFNTISWNTYYNAAAGFVIAPQQDPTSTAPVGMRIDKDGNVAINSDRIANGYTLSVNGKIMATELTIKLKTNWPDYVFDVSNCQEITCSKFGLIV